MTTQMQRSRDLLGAESDGIFTCASGASASEEPTLPRSALSDATLAGLPLRSPLGLGAMRDGPTRYRRPACCRLAVRGSGPSPQSPYGGLPWSRGAGAAPSWLLPVRVPWSTSSVLLS